MGIESKLFQAFCKRIDAAIRKKLKLFEEGSKEKVAGLLEENPKVAMKRKEVKGKLERLEAVARELRLVIPTDSRDLLEDFGMSALAPDGRVRRSIGEEESKSETSQNPKGKDDKSEELKRTATEKKKTKKKKWFG